MLIESPELRKIANEINAIFNNLKKLGIPHLPDKNLNIIGYTLYTNKNRVGESLHLTLSLPSLYATYTITHITHPLLKQEYNNPIIIENGSWICHGNSYGLKPSYTTIEQFIADLKQLPNQLTPDIWLEIVQFDSRINKNGRIKVKFTNNEEYSLKASNIVAIVLDKDKIYVGYKTRNTDFYKKWSTNKVTGRLIFPLIVSKDVCAKCKTEWLIDADEPAEKCWKCGCRYSITIRELKLKWTDQIIHETHEWYPDAPYFQPDHD